MSDLRALDPIRLTRELVEIESTTYHEGAVGDFLAAFLAGRGWQVEKTPVPQPLESATGGDAGTSMREGQARLPIWSFPPTWTRFRPTFPSAKTTISCTAVAYPMPRGSLPPSARPPKRCGPQGYRIGLLFVSGEERDSAGAMVANESPKGSRFLVNGEPTDNRLALASKGALRTVFRATGKMAHSAYPELGDSAIHKLVRVLASLLEMELPVTEDVGPSTLNIGLIHGGRAPNVIADTAEAQVLVRLVGDSAPIRAAILEAAAGLADVDFTLEIPFVRLRAVPGLPTMVAKFTTDIPKLDQLGRAPPARPRQYPRRPHTVRKTIEKGALRSHRPVHQNREAIVDCLIADLPTRFAQSAVDSLNRNPEPPTSPMRQQPANSSDRLYRLAARLNFRRTK